MTQDKFIHYLGQSLFNFISSLNRPNLIKMKKSLIEDMKLHTKGSEILFKREIELKCINYFLS